MRHVHGLVKDTDMCNMTDIFQISSMIKQSLMVLLLMLNKQCEGGSCFDCGRMVSTIKQSALCQKSFYMINDCIDDEKCDFLFNSLSSVIQGILSHFSLSTDLIDYTNFQSYDITYRNYCDGKIADEACAVGYNCTGDDLMCINGTSPSSRCQCMTRAPDEMGLCLGDPITSILALNYTSSTTTATIPSNSSNQTLTSVSTTTTASSSNSSKQILTSILTTTTATSSNSSKQILTSTSTTGKSETTLLPVLTLHATRTLKQNLSSTTHKTRAKPIYLVPCQCSTNAFANKTTMEIVSELVANTSINHRNTSASRRRLTSAADMRQSSEIIGSFGTVVLAIFFCVIACIDVINIVRLAA